MAAAFCLTGRREDCRDGVPGHLQTGEGASLSSRFPEVRRVPASSAEEQGHVLHVRKNCLPGHTVPEFPASERHGRQWNKKRIRSFFFRQLYAENDFSYQIWYVSHKQKREEAVHPRRRSAELFLLRQEEEGPAARLRFFINLFESADFKP